MIVYFANRRLEVLGMASTNLERSYIIKDDLQTEEVSSGISTLDLTVGWDMNDQKTLQEWMEVGNTVLMPQDEGSDEAKLYSIVQETIDTGNKSIEVYCEDAGLDFINEVAPAYSAGEAHEAQYYINKYLGDSGYEIGQNDMSTSASKKLSWDGESTVAERIQSIANSFGCEVSYTYQVHGMEVTHKYINLLSKRGDQASEPQIRLNIEADKITTSKSIEDLATALIVTGGIPKDSKDNKPVNLMGYSYDDGNYYVDKTTGRVCSKQGMQAWTRLSSKYYNVPSGDSTSGQIVKTYSYDTTDKATLVSHAVAELKKVDHPSVTYEVEIPKLPEGVWVGDRVSIVDDAGELYVSARVLELEISRTKQSVKITVGDYLPRSSGISDQVEDLANQWSNSVAAMAEIAKQAAAAQSTADAANTAASKAQSTADSANTAAGNAQSTADGAATAASSAQTAASNAQTAAESASTAADAAQSMATDAAKEATDYLMSINGGVLVAKEGNTIGALVSADGDFEVVPLTWTTDGKAEIGTALAKYDKDKILLGSTSQYPTIQLGDDVLKYGAEYADSAKTLYLSNGSNSGHSEITLDNKVDGTEYRVGMVTKANYGYAGVTAECKSGAGANAYIFGAGVYINGTPHINKTPTRTDPTTFTGTAYVDGFLTNASKGLRFTIPYCPAIYGTPTSITASIKIRQNGKYIYGSASASNIITIGSDSFSVSPLGVSVVYNLSTALSGATNNDLIAIDGSFTFNY